ncbi:MULTISPECIES: chloramphenicol phosphotransferase CPT family protein [Grimontia]|uniref:Chloramphenicol 3-O phosphotransferase n=1 Tax=Grimontia marina TaxID=646534 RepID=A0A128FIB5_9GAMM|nr:MULTISPECIES: chloramphenicol phosphotransferase [Grimontia]WRW00388.1 chloramphenicol phosphotransferase [Grimontia sp. NTOU-MAR1]CZF86528.1 Chloramphenicol 3-O phosphotransferase [Grimontia marina]
MLPQIIILNGTGSAGKTSIAKELIEHLPRQYLNFSIDSVLYALPPSDLKAMMEGKAIFRKGYSYPTLVEGYHQAAKGLATAGCFLILDNAWTVDEEKRNLLAALEGFTVCIVGVKCHLLIAAKREKERGDRAIGLAESEFNHVHQHLHYDIELDTTSQSPEEVTRTLLKWLETNPTLLGAKHSYKRLNARLNPVQG